MSKKAEERALEAYPNESFVLEEYADMCRSFFIEGYERAEKDLALSIDDIEKIHTFLYAIKNNKQGAFTFTRLSDEQYKEVLRRFKAVKEEEK